MTNKRIIYQIVCLPGIQRDNPSDTQVYNDGQWVRFYRKRPKKMGGMKRATKALEGPIRLIQPNFYNNVNYLHTLSTSGIERSQLDSSYDVTSIVTRTITGFAGASADWLWQSDVMPDVSGGSGARLIIHANKNGTIDEETAYPIYYAYLNDTAAFGTTSVSVSGGCCVLGPYLFAYGSNGLIKNSIAGNPATWTGGESNEVNVVGSKILKGMSTRGSGQTPAGLFWSRESLIRVSFIGGTALWKYDIITNQTSLLSANATIEYDGAFFWLGTDRFFMFNGGQVAELPNTYNINWFFENLNWTYRHRIWAMKVPRWGEIWWFFPSTASSGECDRAIIFNVREGCWYDAQVSRSAGVTASTLQYPLCARPDQLTGVGDKWAVYTHDNATDLVEGATTTAIESYFETAEFGFNTGGMQDAPAGPNRWTRVIRVEPDFNQAGDMSVSIRGNSYANDPIISSTPVIFTSATGKVDMREQRRNVTAKFTSNTIGGDYEMGKVLLHLEEGDVRG